MATITGTNSSEVLTGTEDADLITTFDGSDLVEALGGNDRVVLGYGVKRVNAGSGDDTVVFTTTRPAQTFDFSFIDGAAGLDTLDFSGTDTGIRVQSGGGDADGYIRLDGDTSFYKVRGFERVMGSGFNDALNFTNLVASIELFGGGGDDFLRGGELTDLLDGGAGGDVLTGLGSDRLFGGDGNDVLNIEGVPTDVSADGGAGFDTLGLNLQDVAIDLAAGTITSGGSSAGVRFASIEAVQFSSGRTLRAAGDEGANRFSAGTNPQATSADFDGRGGNDTLIGTAGDDRLRGGEGDDLIQPFAGANTVDGGAGVDAVAYDDRLFTPISVNLTTGTASTGDVLIGIENIRGGSQRDILIGNEAANLFEGLAASDRLEGLGGNDTLDGGGNADTLLGGDGDDTLIAASDDFLDGGAGTDTAVFAGPRSAYTVTTDPDGTVVVTRAGGFFPDRLVRVEVLRFSDQTVVLGETRGGITLTPGNDQNFGTAGNDTVSGAGGDDRIFGGDGADTLFGDGGADLINGENGDDVLRGGAGDDLLTGETGADQLFGDFGFDVLLGGLGNDSLNGQDGADALFGEDGNDILSGELGDDQLFGSTGDDQQLGGAGNDTVNGEGGADLLLGGDGDDLMSGETGSDVVRGEAGNDVLLGGFGADFDRLEGGAGNDALFGEGGSDVLVGGEGDDALWGGAGVDSLSGGAGRDRFVFRADELDGRVPGATLNLGGIEDYALFEDVIDVSQIDANVNLAGDQAFVRVDAFTGVAGQAVLRVMAGVTDFLGDIDGDGLADFVFSIRGPTPSADSLIL